MKDVIVNSFQGRRLWCGWYGHGRTTLVLAQKQAVCRDRLKTLSGVPHS